MTRTALSEFFTFVQKNVLLELNILSRCLPIYKSSFLSISFTVFFAPLGLLGQEDRRAAALDLWAPKTLEEKQEISETSPDEAPYNWFDQIVGVEQLGIHEGEVYVEKHRVKGKTSKFLPSPDFSGGSVHYNSQTYFNINLKYDAYDDELLLLVENNLGGNPLKLSKAKVEHFEIQGHQFKHIKDLKDGVPDGFYEIVLDGDFFDLLIKHSKLPKQQLEGSSVFYTFEDLDKLCLLQLNGNYELLDDLTDLENLFPKYKEALKAHHANQKGKSEFYRQLQASLKYLELWSASDDLKGGQQ
ncbi:MAG: hypothetical protein AB3N14_19745 [Flavobacteriaceae bacterium]